MRFPIVPILVAVLSVGCVSGNSSKPVVDLREEVISSANRNVQIIDFRTQVSEYEKVSRRRHLLGEAMINPPAIDLLDASVSTAYKNTSLLSIRVDTIKVYHDYNSSASKPANTLFTVGDSVVVTDNVNEHSNHVVIEFEGRVNSKKKTLEIFVAYDEDVRDGDFWSSPGFSAAILKGFDVLAEKLIETE